MFPSAADEKRDEAKLLDLNRNGSQNGRDARREGKTCANDWMRAGRVRKTLGSCWSEFMSR